MASPKSTPKEVPAEQYYKSWRDVPKENWRWPNFSPEEIACRGDGTILVNAAAMDALQALRAKLGKPLMLNSAYRSPAYNKKVGGASHSQHLLGKAFDVSMENHIPADFEIAAASVGFQGFGHYPKQNFMHVDIGPKRRWFQGSWFPTKTESQEKPVPRFEEQPKTATVLNSIMKPEVISLGAAAIGTSGVAKVAEGNGPVAWGLAVVLVLVAVVALGFWIRRQRHPKLND